MKITGEDGLPYRVWSQIGNVLVWMTMRIAFPLFAIGFGMVLLAIFPSGSAIGELGYSILYFTIGCFMALGLPWSVIGWLGEKFLNWPETGLPTTSGDDWQSRNKAHEKKLIKQKELDQLNENVFSLLQEQACLEAVKVIVLHLMDAFAIGGKVPLDAKNPDTKLALGRWMDEKALYDENQGFLIGGHEIAVFYSEKEQSDWDGEVYGFAIDVCLAFDGEVVLEFCKLLNRSGADLYSIKSDWKISESSYGLQRASLNTPWIALIKQIASELTKADELYQKSKREAAGNKLVTNSFNLGDSK